MRHPGCACSPRPPVDGPGRERAARRMSAVPTCVTGASGRPTCVASTRPAIVCIEEANQRSFTGIDKYHVAAGVEPACRQQQEFAAAAGTATLTAACASRLASMSWRRPRPGAVARQTRMLEPRNLRGSLSRVSDTGGVGTSRGGIPRHQDALGLVWGLIGPTRFWLHSPPRQAFCPVLIVTSASRARAVVSAQ